MNPTLKEALRLTALGLSVIPIKAGEKAPGLKWTTYQERIPTDEELNSWFGNHYQGDSRFARVGVVCGAVSGNLEMFEIEGRVADRLPELDAYAQKDPARLALWWKVRAGWAVETPSGGMHWHVRTDTVPPRNTKIAAADKTEIFEEGTGELTGKFEQPVYAETRGEKGQTVVPPSDGWKTVAGGPDSIPHLTAEEREILVDILFTLDERTDSTLDPWREPVDKIREERAELSPFTPSATTADQTRQLGRVSPIDDWKQKTPWDEIMEEIGWKEVRGGDAGQRAWLRPGDTGAEHSGYTGGENDNLYIFSTSTEFEEGSHTKESIIANHRYPQLPPGPERFKQFTKDLGKKGFGEAPKVEVAKPRALSLVPPLEDQGTGTEGPAPAPGPMSDTVEMFSGDGIVQAYLGSHGHTTRCVVTDKGRTWFVWDGTKWAHDPGPSEVTRRVMRYARQIRGQAKTKEEFGFVDRVIAGGGMRSILPAIAVECPAELSDFDVHPLELNTPGGIVDLATGELGPHRIDRMHTKITECTPDPAMDRALWLGFLDTTFGGDQELIDYVQRAFGYMLIGRVDHQVLFFLYGEGNNGKSVLVDTIAGVLGGDYSTSTPAGFLSKGMPAGEVKNTIEVLRGRRFINIEETDSDATFDEGMVKKLTSVGMVLSRANYADYSAFKPSHTIFVSGNFEPNLQSGPSKSFMRRFNIIPFNHEIAEEDIDVLLTDKLLAAGPVVLAWIIEGALAYQTDLKLPQPPAVEQATREYVEDQDTVGQWLASGQVVYGPAAVDDGGEPLEEKTGDVRAAYLSWCRRAQIDNALTDPKQFAQALKRHGVGSVRRHAGRMKTNINLLSGRLQDLNGQVVPAVHPSPFKTGAGVVRVPDYSPGSRID